MRRYLVVANQTLGAEELRAKVRELMAAEACSFHIVVPATPPSQHLTWREEEASSIARERLDRALTWFWELGADADGAVADADPMLAIWDALNALEFDHIILCTLPPGISRWLKLDLPARVRAAFEIPVSDIVSALEPSTARR
jgi:hypothetical protein